MVLCVLKIEGGWQVTDMLGFGCGPFKEKRWAEEYKSQCQDKYPKFESMPEPDPDKLAKRKGE